MVATDPGARSPFVRDYQQARQQFLAAAQPLCDGQWQGELIAHRWPVTGPAGEALFTDSLFLGNRDADAVQVVICATHGVEGFAGSAIITHLLQSLASATPSRQSPAILVIHAFNAWGMAWRRRCDHLGIDLNRNFIDFSKAPPANPGYGQLRDALMHADLQTLQQQMHAYGEAHGQDALETAISGGQYEDPLGPFYGGTGPAFSNQLVHQLIDRYQLAGKRLAVVDLHTGLGPFGYGEIICDHQPDSANTATAQRWYGKGVALPFAGTSFSVPKLGLLDYTWHAIMNDDSCFVTLEFGTYSTEQLFGVLIEDHRHWARQPGTPNSPAVLEHFCPDDNVWQQMVIWRGLQVLKLAYDGLTRDGDADAR